uniref:Uncharacterized protein n=1 Tax=Paramormyrops kingsleyae TaxID=1676925 RepID=A0A3B3RGZ4_9TELE
MGGQKCLYQLLSANVHFTAGKHTTPVKKFVDDVSFRLVPSDLYTHCRVSGFSISETWYVAFNHGTNYCNLYNLMEGSGLTDVPGYKEMTSAFICTQRSRANCTV